MEKLNPENPKLKPQRMLLATWIIELKLNEINNYQASMEGKQNQEGQQEII